MTEILQFKRDDSMLHLAYWFLDLVLCPALQKRAERSVEWTCCVFRRKCEEAFTHFGLTARLWTKPDIVFFSQCSMTGRVQTLRPGAHWDAGGRYAGPTRARRRSTRSTAWHSV